MPPVRDFFENIDFSFEKDIKPKDIVFSENFELTEKTVFAYDSPENTNTSFYLISKPVSKEELFEIRKYIWNENKYDLYITTDKENIKLCYAKNSPREDEIEISTFKLTELENQELEKIKKWKFDTGAFWMEYSDFLERIKKNQRIDEKLIEQLKNLKTKLEDEIKQEIEEPHQVVQALIDRTLFIKFLEDNHIINSFFYNFYFPNYFSEIDEDSGYKKLLAEFDVEKINFLYGKINEIFNNILFKTPTIKNEYLNKNVLNLIYEAICQKNWETGQLSLFDFRFDVIPIEFISHIYEVFLEKDQLDEGIFYTPTKLAQLIIDDVITKQGMVLDPACGSGMFLILGFRKLLEINPPKPNLSVTDKINYKINILKKYIFGIEKENTAWRLTIFSLYIEILRDLSAEKINEYIKQKIELENDIRIFPNFSENIINGNSLEVYNLQHQNKTFEYIVGNPPFLQISPKAIESSFINNYRTVIDGKEFKATDVVGYKQLSQAFMLKIKDWANEHTKFGFVLNSSNFYNEKSRKFQDFFFKYYQIESFYELSRVKKILFKKAKESVIVTIFNNNKVNNNDVNYYPVDLELFSQTFDLLIIKEDKRVQILQKEILNKDVNLRDYLIGNEFDLKLLDNLSGNRKLDEFLLKDKNYSSLKGLDRATAITISNYFKNRVDEFEETTDLNKIFAEENYLNSNKTDYYDTPYIYQPEGKIEMFKIVAVDGYMNEQDATKNNFQRPRNTFIYKGENIIFNRFGKRIEAAFVNNNLFFSNLIYGIKLQEDNSYHLFTAILNSELTSYYLSLKYRKRVEDNYANLDTKAIKNIPIPKELDKDLVSKISEISKQLTEGKLQYKDKTKEELNNFIYDLYDLGYLERQRIKDFFSLKKEAESKDLEEYKITLYETLEMYCKIKPQIKLYHNQNLGFNLIVAAVYFNNSYEETLSGEEVRKYKIHEILKETNEKFLAMREIVFAENCAYIIKDNQFKNWSETKGFEDGKFILKKKKLSY